MTIHLVATQSQLGMARGQALKKGQTILDAGFYMRMSRKITALLMLILKSQILGHQPCILTWNGGYLSALTIQFKKEVPIMTG